MNCARCAAKLDAGAVVCPKCGARVMRTDAQLRQRHGKQVRNGELLPRKRLMSRSRAQYLRRMRRRRMLIFSALGVSALLIVAAIAGVIVGAVSLIGGAPTQQLRAAIRAGDGAAVYEIYTAAVGDVRRIEKYDRVFSDTLNAMLEEIRTLDLDGAAKRDSAADRDGRDMAQFVQNTITDKWSGLLTASPGFEECLSQENAEKLRQWRALSHSAVLYGAVACAYYDDDADGTIDRFLEMQKDDTVDDNDPFYAKAYLLAEERVEDFAALVTARADDYLQAGNVRDAETLIDKTQEILQNAGLHSDTLTKKRTAMQIAAGETQAA